MTTKTEELRKTNIILRVSETEKEEIYSLASTKKMNVSEYIRKRCIPR